MKVVQVKIIKADFTAGVIGCSFTFLYFLVALLIENDKSIYYSFGFFCLEGLSGVSKRYWVFHCILTGLPCKGNRLVSCLSIQNNIFWFINLRHLEYKEKHYECKFCQELKASLTWRSTTANSKASNKFCLYWVLHTINTTGYHYLNLISSLQLSVSIANLNSFVLWE